MISPSLEADKRLEKIINGEINKELIVLGSSRGARNIIAGQIEDSLGLSSYNLSYPGSDIEFHEFILRTLLQFNDKPKVVLLAVDDPAELIQSNTIKFRLDRLYPLVRYKYINDELIKRKEKSFLSDFFVLSKINKSNFDIRKKRFYELDTILNCGSMPISFQRSDRDFFYGENTGYQKKNELKSKTEAFLKLQNICIENNIKLYIVFCPNFKNHDKVFEKRIRDMTYPNVSVFLYDTLNTIYKEKSLFYDEGHLITHGAVLFTNEVITELKTLK